MKIPKIFFLLAISFSFFCFSNQVTAQTSRDLVVKGDAVEQVLSLLNTSGGSLTNPEIEVVLPTGVLLYPGSLDLSDTGLGSDVTYSLLGSNPALTGFIIRVNGTFSDGALAQIRFSRIANCSVVPQVSYMDRAFVRSNNTISTQSNPYYIIEPIMYPTVPSTSIPAGSAIAGQTVEFSYGVSNSVLNSYVSNFYITINHAGFELPTDVVLKYKNNTVNVNTSDIITVDASNIEFRVTSAMLTTLGLTAGRASYDEEIGLTFKAVPKITSCGSLIIMKISTRIEDCLKVTSDAGADIRLAISSPGTVLSSFTVERTTFDFPDEAISRTRNGEWSWNGGSVNPLKDQVRNGDTLELRLKGSVYTSSLFPVVGQIYADIFVKNTANADTYDDFIWNSLLTIRAKDALGSWTESTVMADITDNNGFIRYKVGAAGNIRLQSGGEVELVITAVLKNTATDNTPCKFSADMYATGREGLPAAEYPTTSCRSKIIDIPLKRVIITDDLKVETTAFTGSCSAKRSSVKFTSSELSTPSVADNNYFTQEFRANHYVKELQVYVSSEATLQAGSVKFDGEVTSTPLVLPSYTNVSFTANATTYPDAKLYVFDISTLYGDYDAAASKFRDEYPHELLFDFDVVYSNSVGGSGQASSILYVATPANPSIPNAILSPISAVQTVLLPAVAPVLTASPSHVDIVGGKAIWTLNLNNPMDAAAIDNASLKIENITGGSFSNLVVRLDGAPVPVLANVAELGDIASNETYVITIEATVDQACSEMEKVVATLSYKPCGASSVDINSVELSFATPASTVQVISVPSAFVLEMCEKFTVKMTITATEGVVYDPKAVLVFPKSRTGGIGVMPDGIAVRITKNGVTTSHNLGDAGIIGGIEDITFDLKDIAGAPSVLEAGVPANRSVEIEIDLKPTCDFPIDAKLVSYAYGRNYCSDYNSKGSGTPISTDVLTINGLLSAYNAEVKFSESILKFDKVLNERTTTLSIKQLLPGGTVGANDVVALTMPASLKLKTNPTGFISDNIEGSGASAVRVVTWSVPTTLSTSTSTDYALTFIMENPAAYTDLLQGTITAVVVNKVTGLACGAGSCQDIETKAGESSVPFEIVDLFPGLAKDVSYKANSLLSYTFTYTFTLKNFGSLTINNIRLQDDLSEYYSKGTVRNINVATSSADLIANTAYNGNTNMQLLTSASKLLPNETQTVTLSFDILFDEDWKNKTFTISNTAVLTGSNENGTDYEDTSNNGTDPDLTDDTPTITTPIDTNPPEVEVVPVVKIPPPGFAITADGVECFEGDSGTFTPLEFEYRLKDGIPLDYDLCFTVFTRDSIATIADSDYQRVSARVICIDAGNVSANETVTVTIVGDDKYEKDEPLILDIKYDANAMTCKPPIVTIINDDAIPTIIIDDITQPTKEPDLSVPNIGNLYQLEGTSSTQRTVFEYCVTLNAAAPQDLVLKVAIGNENDTAIKGRDYYSEDEITKDILMGEDRVCFTIEVEPDDIPENNEFFTMSFSLEAGGAEFYQEVRKAYIIDDDDLDLKGPANALTYCPGDDAVERLRKLNAYIGVLIPTGYEPRWYASQTTGVQISEPLMEAALPGDDATYYLGLYSFDENYETPIGQRATIKIILQSAPHVSITSTPASPITLFSGQTVLFAVTPSGLASYNFTLNGTTITQGALDNENERTVHRDKFTYTNLSSYTTNTIDVVIVDSEGCAWNESKNFEVKQIELPNAFIPEGNNPDNQLFLKGYDIKVFNRWGHLLYEGTEGWDGRYKSSYVASGTYFYVVYITQEDGTVVEEKGFVMVVGAAKK